MCSQTQCEYTRAFMRLLAVQTAHCKAHRHVERMQAKKPTSSREALDAAYAKRMRTGYAYVVCMQQAARIAEEMRDRDEYGITLCPVGMNGDCVLCTASTPWLKDSSLEVEVGAEDIEHDVEEALGDLISGFRESQARLRRMRLDSESL